MKLFSNFILNLCIVTIQKCKWFSGVDFISCKAELVYQILGFWIVFLGFSTYKQGNMINKEIILCLPFKSGCLLFHFHAELLWTESSQNLQKPMAGTGIFVWFLTLGVELSVSHHQICYQILGLGRCNIFSFIKIGQ